jgi:hypothetical protein
MLVPYTPLSSSSQADVLPYPVLCLTSSHPVARPFPYTPLSRGRQTDVPPYPPDGPWLLCAPDALRSTYCYLRRSGSQAPNAPRSLSCASLMAVLDGLALASPNGRSRVKLPHCSLLWSPSLRRHATIFRRFPRIQSYAHTQHLRSGVCRKYRTQNLYGPVPGDSGDAPTRE